MRQTLKLRSDPSELRSLRAFVARCAERTGLDERHRYEACLVATEAVTNAIRHAEGTDEITVLCRLNRGELLIEVQDRGAWRSGRRTAPARVPDPGPEDLGGRGLFLIQELTSDFELEKGETGTRVSMRFGDPGDRGGPKAAVAA